MAIKDKEQRSRSKPVIDIAGPNGNAFVLLGTARNLANQLGRDPEKIIDVMMQGDYEHLLAIFDKEFGDYIDLQR